MTILVELIADYSEWIYGLCAIGILIYLRLAMQARGDKRRALFTLEKEAASSRIYRAIAGIFALLLAMGVIYSVDNFLAPQVRLVDRGNPTPTLILPVATPTGTPAPPTATPSPTPMRPRPTPTLSPTPTPPPPTPTPPPVCPDPRARITSPTMDAELGGTVQIEGSANIDNFKFYKLEYGVGDEPSSWHSIGEEYRSPVIEGLLCTWDTTQLPPGAYTLRLTVVDITGNYPITPCDVRVVIKQ